MLAKSKYYQIQRHLSLSFSITLLTLIILTSVFYSKSNGLQSQQAESFLHYIHKNINTPPIISIKIDQKCPENYQKEPLFIWMGTLDGCYCENTLKMQN